MKLLYKPFALIFTVIGAKVGKNTFKSLWARIDKAEPPKPTTEQASTAVPALALGPTVVPGSRYSSRMSHYGLLRTIEDAWGLPRLGHSAQVRPITGIWR